MSEARLLSHLAPVAFSNNSDAARWFSDLGQWGNLIVLRAGVAAVGGPLRLGRIDGGRKLSAASAGTLRAVLGDVLHVLERALLVQDGAADLLPSVRAATLQWLRSHASEFSEQQPYSYPDSVLCSLLLADQVAMAGLRPNASAALAGGVMLVASVCPVGEVHKEVLTVLRPWLIDGRWDDDHRLRLLANVSPA